ncbi:MAG: class I SAM-dependent methyltransferase [Candidatus Bathyarchaeia archaeon]
MLGTKLEERYWATKHLRKGDDWGKEGDDWVKGYWESRTHSHRNFLVDRILNFSPLSVLEVGCNCGPNLYLLAKKLTHAEIKGVDINPMAVQKGNEWLRQESITNVELLVGKADDLRRFRDKSFDVVFTDAVLIYVGPDKIRKVIREMLRVTRKALIFLEWHTFDKKRGSLGFYSGHWIRNYKELLKEFVPENKIKIVKLPEELWPDLNWQRWGYIIEVAME